MGKAHIVCLQRLNGNMLQGLERPQRLQTEISLKPVVHMIRIWMRWVGTVTIRIVQHNQLPRKIRTTGAFMTCTVMCGNGVKTGMEIIHPVLQPTPQDRPAARTGCFAAAAGTPTPSTAVQRIGTAAILPTGTPTWASAS